MKTFKITYEFNGSVDTTILLLQSISEAPMYLPDSAVIKSVKILN